MFHDHDGGFGMAGGIMMIVFWAAVIIALVVFVIWLVRQTQTGGSTTAPPPSTGSSDKSALDILKTRYAQGEIDKAEFEEKKKDLDG